MSKKSKKVETQEVYTIDSLMVDCFIKKANSYLDDNDEPIAEIEILDHELYDEGVEVEISVDFRGNEKAKENFDAWFENELDDELEFSQVEEVTEDWE